ncbi:MAG: DUF2029 domain-containing protein [Flavobacteriales bacterium]|nr:DUF2029 domain-containing protein [Flavobacteriales bacterium]
MPKTVKLYVLLAVCAAIYIAMGYCVERTDFTWLISLLFSAFLVSGLLFRYFDDQYKLIAFVSILFRGSLLFSIPALSDDFYRFFWDGTLYANGLNPYLIHPGEYIRGEVLVEHITPSLFEKLNSPNYFTVYPPVCQYLFALASVIGRNISESVLVMKGFILLAEIGSIFLIIKLLRLFKMQQKNVLIYALNPLVIMELSGNLHFEAVMIFFFLLAVYFLKTRQIALSATTLSMAVAVKLLPLIFLPFLLRRLKFQQIITYSMVIAIVLGMLFYPFISQPMLDNLWSSINLYFQTFEFNASIYYLVRSVGFYITGYNVIAIIGPALSGITLLVVLYLAMRKNAVKGSELFVSMLLAVTVYFLLSTTVHPWYITTLVALSVFTKYRYALLWSFLVLLSYASYGSSGFSENFYLLWVEYLLVVGIILYELFRKPLPVSTQQQPPPS